MSEMATVEKENEQKRLSELAWRKIQKMSQAENERKAAASRIKLRAHTKKDLRITDEALGRQRMTSSERAGMMQVAVCDHILCRIEQIMPNMIARARARKWLRMAKAFVGKALQAMLDVSSTEDLLTMEHEIKHVDYVATYTHKPTNYKPEDWKFVRMEDMVVIMKALNEHCQFCTKDPQEQRQCELAKAKSRISGFDHEAMNATCRFFNP